jgi:calcineurin-like phosphoesterase family protein
VEFFTSDEHLGHGNIIKFCQRPYVDPEVMTEMLLANHNLVVQPGDSVYHLGDIFWKTLSITDAMSYLSRLNGHHYYVRGNHEVLFERFAELRSMFRWTKDIAEIKVDNYPKIILCHYAMKEWHSKDHGSWHLFGHSHGQLPEEASLSFDVGVDAWAYFPVSIKQVAKKMQERKEWINYASRSVQMKEPQQHHDLLYGDW